MSGRHDICDFGSIGRRLNWRTEFLFPGGGRIDCRSVMRSATLGAGLNNIVGATFFSRSRSPHTPQNLLRSAIKYSLSPLSSHRQNE
jgi:hypothetical protein